MTENCLDLVPNPACSQEQGALRGGLVQADRQENQVVGHSRLVEPVQTIQTFQMSGKEIVALATLGVELYWKTVQDGKKGLLLH